MFRIGQKVVCINDTPVDPSTVSVIYDIENCLVKGNIYTITGVNLRNPVDLLRRPCVSIAEGERPNAYLATRFRPLIETKTDISIFTEMLKTTKKTEEV